MRKIDLVGKVFGLLTVIECIGSKGRQLHWMCQCQCGKVHSVQGGHLRSGSIKSCGCIGAKRIGQLNYSHGLRQSSEYVIWCAMKARCCNPENPNFKDYGGRGILIWKEWLKSFKVFYRDMGERPSPLHTLERIDNLGHYTPDNCRWATRKEQARNRRSNRLVEYEGKIITVKEMAESTGVPYTTLLSRLNRILQVKGS